jgi:hypothetical protein
MRRWVWMTAAAGVVVLLARISPAQVRQPFELDYEEPDNVYAPPQAPTPDQGINQGGVHFALDISYFSTYMYRGVDQSTPPMTNEHALQFDGRLDFDLGKLPHPFIGVFSNIFNHDPVSRFEEVRPYGGLSWTIRPITIAGGYNAYIYPNRQGKDTQEAWMSITVDDSRFWHTEGPVFQPYVYGAYDFVKYHGFYLEGGIRHDFVMGNSGVVISAIGDFAYVSHDPYFMGSGPDADSTGFQHYDGGMELRYDLGTLFNLPRRYGTWELKGYLIYTGSVQSTLRADNRLWGGVAIGFSY